MNFESVEIRLKPSDILSKISEYDIFKYYCSNFESIGVSFLSDLRKTDTPNCRIFFTHSNELKYHDFKLGETLNCWQYVMEKFGCNFNEALNIVSNDFCIGSGISYIEPRVIVSNDEFKLKISNKPRDKSRLEIKSQGWNIKDFDFWSQFGIPLNTLDLSEAYPANYVNIIKNNQRYCYSYKKTNPIYVYNEYDINLNFLGYRVYFPFEDKNRKWINNSSSKAIQGIKLLPEKGELLILTKSMKDVLTLYGLGYNAVSLASETTSLMEYEYNKLIHRFDNIVSLYDNDETGKKYSQNNLDIWNIFCTFIPENTQCKDVSDLYKKVGKEECEKVLKKIL